MAHSQPGGRGPSESPRSAHRGGFRGSQVGRRSSATSFLPLAGRAAEPVPSLHACEVHGRCRSICVSICNENRRGSWSRDPIGTRSSRPWPQGRYSVRTMSGGISSKRLGRKDECEKPGLPTHATNDDGVAIEPRKELLNCIVVFLLFTWACRRPRPRRRAVLESPSAKRYA